MQRFIAESFAPILAAVAASRAGMRRRVTAGLAELVPQLLFYATHGIVIFSVFRTVGGRSVPSSSLVTFFFIMCCVDALGDALFFKGLWEFCAALRRRSFGFYRLAPGSALAKALFLRFDVPMVAMGAVFGLVALVHAFLAQATSPLLLAPAIAFGIAVHILLTSAFHLVQAAIDPTMPISFGSPASRYYTRPLHLFVKLSATGWLLSTIYPAYFITGLPAAIASGSAPWHADAGDAMLAMSAGLVSVGVWVVVMNAWVRLAMRRWS